jgi:hypothetical protein
MFTELKPTWSIVDSSKLDCFQRCRRMFFYQYILGWRPDLPNHDLWFGEAWHKAREFQLLNGYSRYLEAYEVFEDYYRKEFPEETDELYMPKTPMAALTALEKFAYERERDLIDNEVLLTETSGTVPIDPQGRVLHYRMDSILRRREDYRIFSWDHKSKKKTFNRQWSETFQLSIQNGTYTHCMYCMYPIDEVLGVEFCGTAFDYLVRGSRLRPQGYNIEFLRVPAFKPPDQMNAWLWTVNNLYDELEYEMERLANCRESDKILMAFPMNDTSCSDFFGCAYHDYCISWQNPLQRAHEPPLGFKEEHWNPAEMETRNKRNLKWGEEPK